ncbi:MAG: (d)CMP kinase [Paludibacteraceae bacterium]|nr:(d)CMP kinase [Paludibacteraceae bacterium]
MKRITIAIDGYSSCGKSTISKALAKRLNYSYVDTGAMYRAVALYFLRENGSFHKNPFVAGLELTEADKRHLIEMLPDIHISFVALPDGQHTFLNGEDVEAEIRTLIVGNMASQVSTIREVRKYLVAEQQAMGKEGGIVMDGRDIGTVVFPNAELKLFLTASPAVRAQRRYEELLEKRTNSIKKGETAGDEPKYEDVLKDVEERDYRDTHRKESPLKRADDAVVVDNSNMTREEQMEVIQQIVEERIK